MASNRVRRDVLLRAVKAGKMLARCDYRLTDDYAFDNAQNFGKTGWIPARLRQCVEFNGREELDFITGQMNLLDIDFTGSCGTAWREENGDIVLIVHSNCSYTLRYK